MSAGSADITQKFDSLTFRMTYGDKQSFYAYRRRATR